MLWMYEWPENFRQQNIRANKCNKVCPVCGDLAGNPCFFPLQSIHAMFESGPSSSLVTVRFYASLHIFEHRQWTPFWALCPAKLISSLEGVIQGSEGDRRSRPELESTSGSPAIDTAAALTASLLTSVLEAPVELFRHRMQVHLFLLFRDLSFYMSILPIDCHWSHLPLMELCVHCNTGWARWLIDWARLSMLLKFRAPA